MKTLVEVLREQAEQLQWDAGNVEKTVAAAFVALADGIDARLASNDSEQAPADAGAAEAAPQ